MSADQNRPGLLLGQSVASPAQYTPELLFPIARSSGRAQLDLGDSLPFHGEDIWHAYELSWLNADGRPQMGMATLIIPAGSPNLVESKSLKLYLNSHYNTVYRTAAALGERLQQDLEAVLGAPPEVLLHTPEDPCFAGIQAPGESIDNQDCGPLASAPSADLLSLQAGQPVVQEVLHSHLLRSLCPVTAQPDWATVIIDYRGPALERGALLRYLLAFREQQDFHEQCVERMFTDLLRAAQPERLSVQALYTRRGGLDICPWRSTAPGRAPRYRFNRQ